MYFQAKASGARSCNEHATTCSWHREEGKRTLLEVCVYRGMCLYQVTLGSTVEDPYAQASQEREIESQSRALQEVFGNEARVKIQS